MARYTTVSDVINRTLPEVGLGTSSNVFADTTQAVVQMRNLLTSCGLFLLYEFPWERMRREWTFTTVVPGDTGDYTLPTGWGYMIPQTGWSRTNQTALAGPLSAQEWQYLKARSSTNPLYASFRLKQGQLSLYPQPPGNGIIVALEYVSRYWAVAADTTTYKEIPTANDDVVLFDDLLIIKALKAAFLGAKGFDTTKADIEYEKVFNNIVGFDNSAPVLNVGRRRRSSRLIDSFNAPDSGYG